MASVDEIWELMKEQEQAKIKRFHQASHINSCHSTKSKADASRSTKVRGKKKRSKAQGSDLVTLLLNKTEIDKTKVEAVSVQQESKREMPRIVADGDALQELEHVSGSLLIAALQRDLNLTSSDNGAERKAALEQIRKTLFQQYTSDMAGYTEFFHESCKAIFKRFADPVEKCREVSLIITRELLERVADVTPVLAYLFPALMQRISAKIAYDEEAQLFVHDLEAHEAYKRGKALQRQDRDTGAGHVVVEGNEELRLQSCRIIGSLLRTVQKHGTYSVLHPYFHEVVLFLQSHLRDPFPDLKVEACSLITTLSRTPQFELGMKHYAVALVRATLPVMRHRHARVRCAAVECVHAAVCVPNRDKQKGAGTEAIVDLLGFREENVLPVASFYRPDVMVNHLAEVVSDRSVLVREKVVRMLNDWLTELPDRYDHQTRLLPYLLDLLCDDSSSIAEYALRTLCLCGKQYEEEHPQEIIERRQYGVDGDLRINLEKPLPPPFKERPRIGIRLYVRGNTRRFLSALLNELTNWICKTRLHSVRLMKSIVILCEEYLTMEAHEILGAYVKAFCVACEQNDSDLRNDLDQVFELTGRYIIPDTYIPYFLPRIRGDPELMPYGIDNKTKEHTLHVLTQMIKGSKAAVVAEFFQDIVNLITDLDVIPWESSSLRTESLNTLLVVLAHCRGRGKAAVDSHFVRTGRLPAYRRTLVAAFRKLLLDSSIPSVFELSRSGLTDLAGFENVGHDLRSLHAAYGQQVLSHALDSFVPHVLWTSTGLDQTLLKLLLASEDSCTLTQALACEKTLEFLCIYVRRACDLSPSQLQPHEQRAIMMSMSILLGEWLSCIITSPVTSEDTLSLLMAQVSKLVDVFVNDLSWGSTESLEHVRFELIKVLLTEAPKHRGTSFRLCSTSTPTNTIRAMVRVLCNDVSNEASSLKRCQMINCTNICLSLLKAQMKLYNQGCDCQGQECVNLDEETNDIISRSSNALFDRLDDSSDEVRLSCLQLADTLFSLALVPPQKISANLDRSGGLCYTQLCFQLLRYSVLGPPSPCSLFMSELERVLIDAASVDPSVMLSAVNECQNLKGDETTVHQMHERLARRCNEMLQGRRQS